MATQARLLMASPSGKRNEEPRLVCFMRMQDRNITCENCRNNDLCPIYQAYLTIIAHSGE